MSKRKNKTNINTLSTTELQQELKNATGTRRMSIVKLLEKRNGVKSSAKCKAVQ